MPIPKTQPRDNTYWKRPYAVRWHTKSSLRLNLKNRGYKLHSHLKFDDLAARMWHHDSGHFRYDSCAQKDLVRFARNRQVVSEKVNPSRNELIDLLLGADFDPEFHSFGKLPAELRCRIYEYYLDDLLGLPLENPVEPPLTRASRLLRTEALPLFYRGCEFYVQVCSIEKDSLLVDKWSKAFFRSLTLAKLGNLHKLRICFTIEFDCFDRGIEHRVEGTSAVIEMQPDSSSYSIYMSTHADTLRWDEERSEPLMEANLVSKFNTIMARPGRPQFQAEDILSLESEKSGLLAAIGRGLPY